MKKTISATPLDTLLRLAAEAGKRAAKGAVCAGRVVSSLENGRIVQYGQSNPLTSKKGAKSQ